MTQVIVGIKISHYIRIIQDRFHPTKFRGIRQVFVGFAALMIVATVSLRISDEFDRSVGGSDCNTSLVVQKKKAEEQKNTQHGILYRKILTNLRFVLVFWEGIFLLFLQDVFPQNAKAFARMMSWWSWSCLASWSPSWVVFLERERNRRYLVFVSHAPIANHRQSLMNADYMICMDCSCIYIYYMIVDVTARMFAICS